MCWFAEQTMADEWVCINRIFVISMLILIKCCVRRSARYSQLPDWIDRCAVAIHFYWILFSVVSFFFCRISIDFSSHSLRYIKRRKKMSLCWKQSQFQCNIHLQDNHDDNTECHCLWWQSFFFSRCCFLVLHDFFCLLFLEISQKRHKQLAVKRANCRLNRRKCGPV